MANKLTTEQQRKQQLIAAFIRLQKQRPPADNIRTLGDMWEHPNLDDELTTALSKEIHKAAINELGSKPTTNKKPREYDENGNKIPWLYR